MAEGEESIDYNNILESSVSENNESKNYSASEERGRDGRRGVSVGEEEPNSYELERYHNIERNKQVLHQLGIVLLAAHIKDTENGNQVS